MKSMGTRIKERLSEIGRSQHWLAAEVGVKQPSINALIRNPEGGSKHAVAIAEALGVNPKWLTDGSGPKVSGNKASKNQLVGKVGAGGEVYRFEDGTHLGDGNLPDHLPPGNVAIIEGDSQYPLLWDGWLVVYGPEYQGVPERCVGRLCVVGVKDGPTLLKILKRGKRKGLWDLESINAPTRHDQKVEWAALVEDIRPR